MEEWININERYQVSNKGNVRSLSISRPSKKKYYKAFINGKDLKKVVSKRGYYVLNVTIDGAVKLCNVHYLVARYFIPNPNNYKVINHIDCNTLNNNVENLEWCTQQENIKHSVSLGRNYKKTVYDEKNNIYYPSLKKASEITGIKYPYLSMMMNGRCKNQTTLKYVR